MAKSSLSRLPDEVLHIILRFTPPRSALALESTSQRFENVVNEPLLWRFYCQTSFSFWDSRHDIPGKLKCSASSVDWKRLYISRRRVDVSTTETLDSILASQVGRIEKIHSIVTFGYDAKDTLLRHAHAGQDEGDFLARRYYSNAILTCLHRTIAIPEWDKLRTGEDVPLERALGAFDMFVLETGLGDFDDISRWLDNIATELASEFPDLEELRPREKAIAIARYLRTNNLTGIEPGREYHHIEHNFLGIALNDRGHNSLPLISAAIYCYVARRFGLNASPCGFPFHVHVIIKPAPGYDMDGRNSPDGTDGEPMYMDPFRSVGETPVSDLREQLNFLGALTLSQSTFLGESRTSEIALRCGKNILNSVRQIPQLPPTSLDAWGVKYAALWSTMLFARCSNPGVPIPGETIQLRRHLPWLMEIFATEFPSDVFLVEQYLVPLFRGLPEHEHLLESVHVMRAGDEMPKQVRRRTSERGSIKYRVGQVFRHRRYEYRGIITGWDTECGAGEQWMQTMGVDRLRAGRHQSFYHVLVEDKSVRYVAEENIEIITPEYAELPPTFFKCAGKHFKRWDVATRTFVSNIRDEYPDD